MVLHWARALTLGPQQSFLPLVWPSCGTDPFGWQEKAGPLTVQPVLGQLEFSKKPPPS